MLVIPPSDNIAIKSPEIELTYSELLVAVGFVIKKLKAEGLSGKCNRIAICEVNSVEYIIALLALWKMNITVCLLSPRIPLATLESQLKESGCSTVLGSTVFSASYKSLKLMRLPGICNKKTLSTGKVGKFFLCCEQVLTIMYTSGSQGNPKPAVHTLGNYYHSAVASNRHIKLKSDDQWLMSLPIYHVGGLSILIRCLLANACCFVAQDLTKIYSLIIKYNCTHVSLVMTQLFRLLNDIEQRQEAVPGHSLKAVLVGGSAVSDSLIENAVKKGFPVYRSYGLTEMTSQVATTEKLTLMNFTAEAEILHGVKIKCGNDQEILFQGPMLFQGYINANEVDCCLDEEGWFHSGDLGSIINEKYIKVFGRKDNMFISGGENIQSEEIEHYLMGFDAIKRVIVIPCEDHEFGFRPIAFIKIRDGFNLELKDVVVYLQKLLPKFKIPVLFFDWPQEVDHNNFKIDRNYFVKRLKSLTQRAAWS